MQNTVQSLLSLAREPQFNRLLQLDFPGNDAPYRLLLPNRLEAFESLSKDFVYTLEILSDTGACRVAQVGTAR
ncbi:hypothetical protein [Paraburkholderia oxyphila]|uniref:hypothetical protein n=1 Tax=Paraburkholderia oxyphila TaxID=614212 RepID=UPI000486C3D0|nr:hypothetical protein [Paraburkholderia oxyphila]